MSTSRETTRDALVTLLTAELTGVGLPVTTVTGSQIDLEGNTPLVMVLSDGSLRTRMTLKGDKPSFSLEVLVFVRQATTDWTAVEAEDTLDEIESLIAGVYETYRKTDDWDLIEYAGNTKVWIAKEGGVDYNMEQIPTTIRLARS